MMYIGRSGNAAGSGDQVHLQLRFEGASLTTDEANARTNTFHTAGSPTLSSTSPKWGSGNMDVDATNADENIAATGSNFRASTSASFTIEWWFYPISEGAARQSTGAVLRHAIMCMCTSYPVTALNYGPGWFWWNGASGGTIGFANSGQTITGMAADTWHHIAMVYNGSAGYTDLFADGTRFGHIQSSNPGQFSTLYFGNMGYGGSLSDGSWANYLVKGRYDSIRMRDGVALYDGTTYTVPSADFPIP